MPVTLGIAGGSLALNLGKSIYDRYQSQKQLEDLKNSPMAQYTATPELLSYYHQAQNESNNPLGLTGGEKMAYRNNVAGNINTTLTNAKNTAGGNLYRYLSAGLNPSLVAGENQLVGQDQAIKRNNRLSALGRLGTATNQIQGLSNQNVQAKNYRQQLIAQALGGSIAQQNQNISGILNQGANVGMYLYGQGGGKESGGLNFTNYLKDVPAGEMSRIN